MSNSTLQQLTLLGYESGDLICYRGFLPKKGEDKGRKVEAIYPQLPSDLNRWESEGRGVYVVVNPGGHRDADITQGIAIFYEHDHLSRDISRELWQELGLPEPTFQVDTGSKSIHSYWVFSEPISVEQWKPLQADLLEFADGDRSLKNPSRVMRLAGFKHGETREMATIISQSGQRYDYATLRATIPSSTLAQPSQSQEQGTRAIAWPDFERSFQFPCSESIPLEICLSKTSRKALERGAGEGGRNDTGAKLARDLIGASGYLESLGQRYEGDPRDLFDTYCDRCSPPLPQGERVSIWGSAEKSNPGPSLSPEAIAGCARSWVWKNCVTTASVGGSNGNRVNAPDISVKVSGSSPGEGESRPRLAIKFEAVDRVLGSRLAFNELTNQIEFDGNVVDDPADLRLTLALEHNISVSQADSEAIFKRLAKTNAYHPVKTYLERCSATHGDHADVLDGFAWRYFGVTEPIYQTYIVKMLVGAVARVFEPGCKVDTALILQGAQGCRKSTFFRTLAGSDWFDDSMGAAQGERDERLKLHQFWFLEWGELESIFRKKDIAATKAFLSSQIDTVRPPYGRQAVTLKRRSIIVGSTNQDDFLTDSTGNRRFWVVPVKHAIDTTMLKIERDAIWAAAVSLYRSGFPWWLTPDEEAIAAEFNESWRAEDPWTSAIRAYLLDNREREVTTAHVLNHVLDIEVGLQTKAHEMRIGEVMKSLGWVRKQRRSGNKRVRLWLKPECHNLPDQGCDIGCDKPEPLQAGSFDEFLQNGVTTSNLGCDRGGDSQNNHGTRITEVCHNLHNLLPQNNKHFFEATNGNGHKPNSLDISDEQLAQLLGGAPHGN